MWFGTRRGAPPSCPKPPSWSLGSLIIEAHWPCPALPSVGENTDSRSAKPDTIPPMHRSGGLLRIELANLVKRLAADSLLWQPEARRKYCRARVILRERHLA